MFSEYDTIGINPKFFIKYIIILKEPIPYSASDALMALWDVDAV